MGVPLRRGHPAHANHHNAIVLYVIHVVICTAVHHWSDLMLLTHPPLLSEPRIHFHAKSIRAEICTLISFVAALLRENGENRRSPCVKPYVGEIRHVRRSLSDVCDEVSICFTFYQKAKAVEVDHAWREEGGVWPLSVYTYCVFVYPLYTLRAYQKHVRSSGPTYI